MTRPALRIPLAPAKLAPAAVATVTVTAALFAAALPAQAATPGNGWEIVKTVAPTTGSLRTVVASGQQDAWAVGSGPQALVTKHWSGSAWSTVDPPAAFTGLTSKTVTDTVAAESAATNMWTFPAITGTGGAVDYALRWTGSTWVTRKLPGAVTVTAATVFSPSDVWAFGQQPHTGTGYGAGYAARFNGSSWSEQAVPGTPLGATSLSATDIWAYGPTAATAGTGRLAFEVMQWDGSAWSTSALPKLAKTAGVSWVPTGIVALSDTDVWVSESPGGGTAPGLVLEHWNGRTWAKEYINKAETYAPGLASDGGGGFWLGNHDASGSYISHYVDATMTRHAAPSKSGSTDQAGAFTLVPGTHELWALGTLTPAAGGAASSAILNYQP